MIINLFLGDSRKDGSPESARILSQSETNLRLLPGGSGNGSGGGANGGNAVGEGSVNIEIRQQGHGGGVASSKSSEMLHRYHPHYLRNTGAAAGGGLYRGGWNPSVSVVNLRSSADSPPVGGRNLSTPPNFHQNRIVGPPPTVVIPPTPTAGANLTRAQQLAAAAPQLKRVLSNEMLAAAAAPKSRSVENLYETRLMAAMRSSNSEISLQPRILYPDAVIGGSSGALLGGGAGIGGSHTNPRMKGTKSEQVLTKIGKLEKVKVYYFQDFVCTFRVYFEQVKSSRSKRLYKK